MKICTTPIGEFVVELSDGKMYKLSEKDGSHLYDGIEHPRHYLTISTLSDKETGEKPDLYVDNNLYFGHSSIHLWFAHFDEGYEQGEV